VALVPVNQDCEAEKRARGSRHQSLERFVFLIDQPLARVWVGLAVQQAEEAVYCVGILVTMQIVDRRLGGGRFAAPVLDEVAEWA
jgi:hypothetical protein